MKVLFYLSFSRGSQTPVFSPKFVFSLLLILSFHVVSFFVTRLVRVCFYHLQTHYRNYNLYSTICTHAHTCTCTNMHARTFTWAGFSSGIYEKQNYQKTLFKSQYIMQTVSLRLAYIYQSFQLDIQQKFHQNGGHKDLSRRKSTAIL